MSAHLYVHGLQVQAERRPGLPRVLEEAWEPGDLENTAERKFANTGLIKN